MKNRFKRLDYPSLKIMNLKNPRLIEPEMIDTDEATKKSEGFETTQVGMWNSGARALYRGIGISKQFSNKLFDISSDIWEAVVDMKSAEPKGDPKKPFVLADKVFVGDSGTLVDIIDEERAVEVDFPALLEKFNNYMATSENVSSIRHICEGYNIVIADENKTDEEGMPVVTIDYNIIDGVYRVYSGAYKDGRLIITSKPVFEDIDLVKFLSFDLKYEFETSEKLYESSLAMYEPDYTPLSVREVLDVLNLVACDIQIDKEDGGYVANINGLLDEGRVTKFLNGFGYPFKTLKKMSYLRKSFKCDGLTTDDLLKILTRTYFEGETVNSRAISRLLQISYSNTADRTVIKDELKSESN